MTETNTIEEKKTVKKSFRKRLFGSTLASVMSFMAVMTATTPTASAEINATTFDPITNLIDAVIPLFDSILDLVIAVFPLVIAMAFLGGLALLINKIFDGTLNFSSFKKR